MLSGQENIRKVIYEACERLGISNSDAYELRFLSLAIDAEKKIGTGNSIGTIYNRYAPFNKMFPLGRKIILPHQLISDLEVLNENKEPLDKCKYIVRGNYVLFTEEQKKAIILKFKGLLLDLEKQPFISLNHFEAVVSYLVYMESTTRLHSKKISYYQYKDTREWWQDRLGEARGDDFFSTEKQFSDASLEYHGVWENNFPSPKCPTIIQLDNDYTYLNDDEIPEITLNGLASISIEQNDSYSDLGAIAHDNIDGDITHRIVTSGDIVDTSAVGIYVTKYNVEDSSGNKAIEKQRTVTVNEAWEDKEAPSTLVITASFGSTVQVRWEHATDNVGIKEYQVCFYSRENIGDWADKTVEFNPDYLFTTTENKFISKIDQIENGGYFVLVRAIDVSDIFGDFSNTQFGIVLNDTEAPTVPGNFIANVIDNNKIFVIWEASTDNKYLNKYELHKALKEDTNWGGAEKLSLNNETLSHTFENVEVNKYKFRIRSRDGFNNVSEYAHAEAEIKDLTPPTPVCGVRTEVDDHEITLNWDLSKNEDGSDAFGYEIQWVEYEKWVQAKIRDTTDDGRTDSERKEAEDFVFDTSGYSITEERGNETTISDFENGSWIFRIRSYDDSSPRNYSDFLRYDSPCLSRAIAEVYFDREKPTAPSIEVVVSNQKATVTWTEATDDMEVASYLIEANSNDNDNWGAPAYYEGNPGIRIKEFDNLSNAKYSFRVRAVDTSGKLSDFSNIVDVNVEYIPEQDVVYGGQSTLTFTLDEDFFENATLGSDSASYTLVKVILQDDEQKVDIPYLGYPGNYDRNYAKKQHFAIIPLEYECTKVVNAGMESDVIYPVPDNGPFGKQSDPYDLRSIITVNGKDYHLWKFIKPGNPINGHLRMTIKKIKIQ